MPNPLKIKGSRHNLYEPGDQTTAKSPAYLAASKSLAELPETKPPEESFKGASGGSGKVPGGVGTQTPERILKVDRPWDFDYRKPRGSKYPNMEVLSPKRFACNGLAERLQIAS